MIRMAFKNAIALGHRDMAHAGWRRKRQATGFWASSAATEQSCLDELGFFPKLKFLNLSGRCLG